MKMKPASSPPPPPLLLLLFSALSLSLGAASESEAPLHLLADFPSAKCLDGSPGAYYFRPALAGSEHKWVFSLQGGGECTNQTDCADRATGDLGSSTGYASDGADKLIQLQDSNATANPDFFGWNHVFIMYCTGDLHLGLVTTPGVRQWGWAFFSGAHIVDAVLADLSTWANLSQASEVIWSGDSAGGIGSAAQVDHVQATIPAARVVGAPIAGFYWNNSHPYTGEDALDSYTPFGTDDWRVLFDLYQMRVPDACAAVHAADPWVCGLLNFSLSTTAADMFVIEMLVDSVQLELHDAVPGYTNSTAPFCVQFGRNMTQALVDQVVGGKARGKTGLFAPACYKHTAFYSTGPFLGDGHGINFVAAFADWMYDRGQYDDYLMDDCCSSSETSVDFNPTC